MYIVKKCDSYGHGRNDWKTIYTSPDREGAIAIFKQELRYELEADPNLTRDQINSRLDSYYFNNTYGYYTNRRFQLGHGNVWFSMMKSESAENQTPAMRPDRTALLDSILK